MDKSRTGVLCYPARGNSPSFLILFFSPHTYLKTSEEIKKSFRPDISFLSDARLLQEAGSLAQLICNCTHLRKVGLLVGALCFFCLEKDGADYKSALGELDAELIDPVTGPSVLCGSRFLCTAGTGVFGVVFGRRRRLLEHAGARRRCAAQGSSAFGRGG
ncbi:hypothetical protein ACU8KH_00860 [Lachancea thermotolerans]